MKIELISITPNAERVIEEAGRTCYKSKRSEDPVKTANFIKSIVKSGHSSVLEHASATFRIKKVSRALTHQLVRHRIASYSQQSQRYVSEKQFDFVIPPSIVEMGSSFIEDYKNDMKIIQGMYNKWKDRGLKSEDARYVLPNACHTEIVMSCNFREWRSVLVLRRERHAQWEIRKMADEILEILCDKCPCVFEDLKAI